MSQGVIPSAPRMSGVGKAWWLALMTIGASLLAAYASLILALSQDRFLFRAAVTFAWSDIEPFYVPAAWLACALGLLLTAACCAWRRSRGHRTYRYIGSVLTLLAVVLIMGMVFSCLTSLASGSTGIVGIVLVGLLYGVLLSCYNCVNLLVIGPLLIDGWYAVLNGPETSPARAAAARKRRLILAGICLVLLLVAWIAALRLKA